MRDNRLISVESPSDRARGLRQAGCDWTGRKIRPFVWSVDSGSATMMPVTSRPSLAAATATAAIWSAVAVAAETPITVAVVRIMSDTDGA